MDIFCLKGVKIIFEIYDLYIMVMRWGFELFLRYLGIFYMRGVRFIFGIINYILFGVF